jgi:hypothetical protein
MSDSLGLALALSIIFVVGWLHLKYQLPARRHLRRKEQPRTLVVKIPSDYPATFAEVRLHLRLTSRPNTYRVVVTQMGMN